MSIKIDPRALNGFATQAVNHSVELHQLQLNMNLITNILGSFEEANELVDALNSHMNQVNQRLNATASALSGLARAASQAALLSGASDDEIGRKMKTINREVDEARRKLVTPAA